MKIHTQIQDKKFILTVLKKKEMHFGDHLKKWRKSRGLTQDELAEELGVNISWISNLERNFSANKKSGVPKASEDLAERIALYFGLDKNEVRVLAGHEPIFADSDLLRSVRYELHGAENWSSKTQEEFLQVLKITVAGIKAKQAEEENQLKTTPASGEKKASLRFDSDEMERELQKLSGLDDNGENDVIKSRVA